MNLTNDDVDEIIRLLDSSYYDELHIRTGKFDLHLRRSPSGWTQEMQTLSAPHVVGAVRDAPLSQARVSPSSALEQDDADGILVVRAPMVGTFYRAPKPGASPFVDVGSDVSIDTVVCIVETMKLMNSISAGGSGTVIEILVADGQLVEAGQVLMRLRQVEA